jgi:hypothetical protein
MDKAPYPRPPDSIENPTPLDKPVYIVGVFHTHTPMCDVPSNKERPAGPTVNANAQDDYDFCADPAINIPGFVYDYLPDIYGGILGGTHIDADAGVYPVTPPKRRPLP